MQLEYWHNKMCFVREGARPLSRSPPQFGKTQSPPLQNFWISHWMDYQDKDGKSKTIYPQIVKMLLEKDAQVDLKNKKGLSALMHTSAHGNSEVVKLLLEKGAQVDLQDSKGRSALMYASKEGRFEVAQLLLKRGAQVNLQNDDGMSAMMYASEKGHSELAKLLLENGALTCRPAE